MFLCFDSCVTDDAHQIKKIVQSFDHNNESEVVLKFKVFKLRYSNQLIFENVIKACRNSVDCQPAVSNALILKSNATVKLTPP